MADEKNEIESIDAETHFVFRYKDGSQKTMRFKAYKPDISTLFISAMDQTQSDEELQQWKAILSFSNGEFNCDKKIILEYLSSKNSPKLLNHFGPIWFDQYNLFTYDYLFGLCFKMISYPKTNPVWWNTCLTFVEGLFSSNKERLQNFIQNLYLKFVSFGDMAVIEWFQQYGRSYIEKIDARRLVGAFDFRYLNGHQCLKILQFRNPESYDHLTLKMITVAPNLLCLLNSNSPLPNVTIDFHVWDIFTLDIFARLTPFDFGHSLIKSIIKLMKIQSQPPWVLTIEQQDWCVNRMLFQWLPDIRSTPYISEILHMSPQIQDIWLNHCIRCDCWSIMDYPNLIKLSCEPEISTVIKKCTRSIRLASIDYYFPTLHQHGFELGSHDPVDFKYANIIKNRLQYCTNVFRNVLYRTLDCFVSKGMINQIFRTTCVFAADKEFYRKICDY